MTNGERGGEEGLLDLIRIEIVSFRHHLFYNLLRLPGLGAVQNDVFARPLAATAAAAAREAVVVKHVADDAELRKEISNSVFVTKYSRCGDSLWNTFSMDFFRGLKETFVAFLRRCQQSIFHKLPAAPPCRYTDICRKNSLRSTDWRERERER